MSLEVSHEPMSSGMKADKKTLLDRLKSDRGAIAVRDILTSIAVFVIFGAIAGPFALQQQTQVQSANAVTDARALAIEVERFLASNPNVPINSPVSITYDNVNGILTIPLVGLEGEKGTARLALTPNASLPVAQPGSKLAKANVITSKTQFCVAVSHFGQTAYHTQAGPADSCS